MQGMREGGGVRKTIYSWLGSTDPDIKTGTATFYLGAEQLRFQRVTADEAKQIHALINDAYGRGFNAAVCQISSVIQEVKP